MVLALERVTRRNLNAARRFISLILLFEPFLLLVSLLLLPYDLLAARRVTVLNLPLVVHLLELARRIRVVSFGHG